MILVTTGTNEQGFDRLVRAAAQLGGDERLVVQYGSSRVPHGRGEWVDFVDFDELARLMREARVVVCHAGVGSIMLARSCDRTPVVVPRRGDLGEAVDDHQLPIARQLHEAGIVTLVEDEALLAHVIEQVGTASAAAARTPSLPGAAALAADVRERILSAHAARA